MTIYSFRKTSPYFEKAIKGFGSSMGKKEIPLPQQVMTRS